jgi:glycosyltransferase involved in cell wall biosynthesis
MKNRSETHVALLSMPSSKKPYIRSIERMEKILLENDFTISYINSESTLNKANLESGDECSISLDKFDSEVLSHIYFQFAVAIVLLKHRSNFDLVLMYKGGMGLIIPAIAGRIFGVNIVTVKSGAYMNERDLDHSNILEKIYTEIQKLTFRISDAAIVFNNSAIDTVPSRSVYVASPEFIDTQKFNIETEFNKRGDIIGFVGRFEEVKGIHNICEAISRASEQTELDSILIGNGSQYNFVKENYDQNSQINFTGWVSHSELSSYYNKMKLFIVASNAEGGPVTAMEAMACGVPVIGTPVGVIPDLITDECGYRVPNNQPAELAVAIETALNDNDIENLSKKSRNVIEDDYSFDAVADRYGEIISNEVPES